MEAGIVESGIGFVVTKGGMFLADNGNGGKTKRSEKARWFSRKSVAQRAADEMGNGWEVVTW